MVRSFKKKIAILFFISFLILITVFATSCLRRDTLVDDLVIPSAADDSGTEPQLEESFTESMTSRNVATSESTTASETQAETEDTTTPTETGILSFTKKTTRPPATTKKTTTTELASDTEQESITATTTITTTTTKPPEPCFKDGYAREVLDILNETRVLNNIGSLVMNNSLVASAKVRAKELVQQVSHTRPGGSDWYTAITIPYQSAAENVAAGYSTPSEVFMGWLKSSGHAANMLGEGYTQIGIACWYEPGSDYEFHWVMLLATPSE